MPPATIKEPRLRLTSTAFGNGKLIPKRYTCDGLDISPPLKWENVPEGTQAFALICDDPDAPVSAWDHWVLFNLPAETTHLVEGVKSTTNLGKGTKRGVNSWKRTGYGGPCPPAGKVHRYYFRLYALSAPVDLQEKANKKRLLKEMEPLILEQATLKGLYKR